VGIDIPDARLDWRTKGFWLPDGAVDAAAFAAARHGLFDGAFTWPLLVLRDSAARANIATMAAYCARHGLDFAPHAKTSMAPSLLSAQLDAGAWGLTVATPNQALVLRRLGVPRIFIANEVLDPTALRWIAAENAAGAEVLVQVDSVAGVDAAAAAAGSAATLPVLVELGHAAGRTGCRTPGDLEIVARAAALAPGLELLGVTGYEGGLPDRAAVDGFLGRLADGARALAAAGLLPGRVLVSAGGSAWFDRVVAVLGGLALPGTEARVLLRSGASVSHDDGFYRERTPFRRVPEEGTLTAALDLYAQVLSTPEPGLAIVGMGKRDAPFDEGLPVPMAVRGRDGSVFPGDGLAVTRLNDHHTYLAVDVDVPLAPGDLVRFGISHPCTAFDKWRAVPVVDDTLTVIDVLRTYL
jgi:D-serine deaminase-like pyridoxal phosphate-dependent protein